MTTCPSGVDYAHLIDQARVHNEASSVRPMTERLLRRVLATVIPNPSLFRLALIGGWFARPLARLMPGRLKGMVTMAPARLRGPSHVDRPQVFPAQGPRRKRVALHPGCAQKVLRPEINEATVRLLTRHGCEVVIAKDSGCCGAIVHHMGQEEQSRAAAIRNVAAWTRELDGEGLDAVVSNASGCGVSLKDYGHLLRHDRQWAEPAARVAAITRDVSELMVELGLGKVAGETGQSVTYHPACSMQHGQKLRTESKQLLTDAGFKVREPAESHICCGSAGTYSILQPALSQELRNRKLTHIKATEPDYIAAGNIGCMTHLEGGTSIPVVHTVQLLDWATGGPKPPLVDLL